jgi:tetratricopeptide (TPR) repeat protein
MGNTPIQEANDLFSESKIEESLKIIDDLLKENPNDPVALNNMGNALVMLEQFEDGVTYYQKSIEIDSTVSYPYIGLSLAYLNMEKYNEAIENCEKGVSLGHNNVSFNGLMHQKLGNLDKAIESFQQALTFERDPITLANFAITMEMKDKIKDAAFLFDEAADSKRATNIAEVHTLRGDFLLRHSTEYDKAIACFDRALQIDPKSIEATFYKAEALIAQKKYQEAIDCCEKLDAPSGNGFYYSQDVQPVHRNRLAKVKLFRESPPPISLVQGIALAALGQKEKSKQLLEQVTKLTLETACDHYFVAMAYLELGSQDLALSHFRTVLQLDPLFLRRKQVAFLLQQHHE